MSRSWWRDPATAEILKPYYRYICKRPCFHDEYLQAYNNPNVTLVDCPGGHRADHRQGPGRRRQQYEVDCIIYGTGFEPELTPLYRRAGHEIVGRGGVTLAEKWADGAASLFGMMSRGFPNMFVMPAPAQQAVVTVNYTQLAVLGAEFVGRAIRLLEEQGVEVFDVCAEAEEAWTHKIVDSFVDGSAVMSACTPSRINNEGHPEAHEPTERELRTWHGGLVRLPRASPGLARGRDLRGPGARGPVAGVVTGASGSPSSPAAGAASVRPSPRTSAPRAGSWSRSTRSSPSTVPSNSPSPRRPPPAASWPRAARPAPRRSRSPTPRRCTACSSELADEHGGLDAVVNVAGITRQTGFAHGTEEDWLAVLNVHLGGHLNVLEAALPLMAAAGHGRILGVTSGSGWRAADAGAYSCAKRAIASLTWQLGRQAPAGVTVNAMSPMAATRMVAAALERAQREHGTSSGGGISLASMPGPEYLGPLGAHLVGDGFGWCSGQVLFAGGTEVAVIDQPRLLEVVRTRRAWPPWPGSSTPWSPVPWPGPRQARRAAGGPTPASARSSTSRPPSARAAARCGPASSSATARSWLRR